MSQPTARLALVTTLTAALLAPATSFAQAAGEGAPPYAPYASAPPAEQGRYVPWKPATEMRSKGAVAGGVVLMSLGGLLTLGGAVMLADAPPSGSYSAGMTNLIGSVTLGHGITSLLVGIPLTAWGATSVPSEPEQASAVPSVAVGPTSASAQWAF